MCGNRQDDPAYLSMQEAEVSAPLNRDAVPLTAEELSLLDRLDAIEAGKATYHAGKGIERRIHEIATDPDGAGRELPVDEEGRVWCICGRSTWPENWINHTAAIFPARKHQAITR